VPKHESLRVVSAYGVAHAFVDASCAALVFLASATGRLVPAEAAAAVLAYNLLAFASQPLLGWFVTESRSAHVWARVGASMVAGAFFLSLMSGLMWPAVVLTGLGNAIFHLGGGVVALRAEANKAALPGLFVAPGAAGLALGIWLGTAQSFAWVPAAALVVAILLLGVVTSGTKPTAEPAARSAAEPTAEPSVELPTELPLLVVGTLFAVIVLRSFIGSALEFPWKSDAVLLWALTAAVVAGKAVGGVLADRFGRTLVGVGALVVSIPLLAVGPRWALAGIMGMLLFNMTMPVTLVAMADIMPERPGFAFGLTCLALIFGSLPVLLHLAGAPGMVATVLGVLVSAILLWVGLRGAESGLAGRASAKRVPEKSAARLSAECGEE